MVREAGAPLAVAVDDDVRGGGNAGSTIMRRGWHIAGAVASAILFEAVRASVHAEPLPPPALRERLTGRAFQHTWRERHLLGCSARCMMGWCSLPLARAYAFGVYADAQLLAYARALQAARPVGSAAALSQLLLDQLERTHALGEGQPGSLSIALQLHRDTDGPHLGHGFERSVQVRLSQIERARLEPVADSARAREELRSLTAALYAAGTFAAGEELVFTWSPAQGWLELAASSGRVLHRLTHPTLCRALCDVYVGREAVSRAGAASFQANLFAHAAEGVEQGPQLWQRVQAEYAASG